MKATRVPSISPKSPSAHHVCPGMWKTSKVQRSQETRPPSGRARSTRIGLGQEARDVVAGRVRHDLREVLEDPGLGALGLLEPRQPGQVVVVVVARDDDVDRAEPGHRLQLVERVLDEAHVRRHVVPAGKAVVEEERPAVVGHERVAVRDASAGSPRGAGGRAPSAGRRREARSARPGSSASRAWRPYRRRSFGSRRRERRRRRRPSGGRGRDRDAGAAARRGA